MVKGPLLTLVNIASVANALDPEELPTLLKRVLAEGTDIDEAVRVWPEVSAALLRCAKQDATLIRSVEIPAGIDPALFNGTDMEVLAGDGEYKIVINSAFQITMVWQEAMYEAKLADPRRVSAHNPARIFKNAAGDVVPAVKWLEMDDAWVTSSDARGPRILGLPVRAKDDRVFICMPAQQSDDFAEFLQNLNLTEILKDPPFIKKEREPFEREECPIKFHAIRPQKTEAQLASGDALVGLRLQGSDTPITGIVIQDAVTVAVDHRGISSKQDQKVIVYLSIPPPPVLVDRPYVIVMATMVKSLSGAVCPIIKTLMVVDNPAALA